MKHSPAPWKEEETDEGDVIVKMDESHSVFFGNLEDTCGTCHANARLTSLAPELLETLKNVLEYSREHLQNTSVGMEYQSQADGLIARAEGKENAHNR